MKYVDFTHTPAIEQDLSLHEIQAIIQSDTKRTLIFEDPELAKQYDCLFKLVRLPNPIGFAIVANQRIPKNTVLCPYGGETQSKLPLENNDDIEYLLSCTNQYTKEKISQQARVHGDLGSLFAHLPNLEFLEQIGLSQQAEIQTSNIKVFYDFVNQHSKKTVRLFFISTQDIYPDTIIGFNYGMEYWIESKVSPNLFHRNKNTLIDITRLNFDRVAAFCDQSGKTRIYNIADPKHHIIVGYALKTVLLACKKTLKNDQTGSSPVIFQSMHHYLALSMQEINRVLKKEELSREKHIFLFFNTVQVVGCPPPPNSHIDENGITHVLPPGLKY